MMLEQQPASLSYDLSLASYTNKISKKQPSQAKKH